MFNVAFSTSLPSPSPPLPPLHPSHSPTRSPGSGRGWNRLTPAQCRLPPTMFARYSSDRFRMKGSGVVQGLKSLIHSQLPLTTKESQRLLTALTSSFRRHLDEVHPQSAVQDEKKKPTSPPKASKPQTHAIHSSASHAEKHLASVLTNPLFSGKGQVLDYASAKVDLTKKPRDNPVELLEEYHEKGAASVRIAELCLEVFWKSLHSLSEEQRRARCLQTQAGRRTLIWLLKSGLFNQPEFVDNVLFNDMLVHALLAEGQEEQLWHWLQLDLPLEYEEPPAQTEGGRHYIIGMMQKYRWRGRLLRSVVSAKLDLWRYAGVKPHHASAQEVHEAIDVMARAVKIKSAAPDNHHLRWIPTHSAAPELKRHLSLSLSQSQKFWPRSDLDPQKFDDYIKSISSRALEGGGIVVDYNLAGLWLVHPSRPSPDLAIKLLHRFYDPSSASSHATRKFSDIINMSPSSLIRWYHFMLRTACLLRMAGNYDDADWVKGKTVEHFPQHARFFEKNMRVSKGPSTDEIVEQKNTERVPYPAFT